MTRICDILEIARGQERARRSMQRALQVIRKENTLGNLGAISAARLAVEELTKEASAFRMARVTIHEDVAEHLALLQHETTLHERAPTDMEVAQAMRQ